MAVAGQERKALFYASHNIECISMTNHGLCTRPYRSDQSDELGHKRTLSEKCFLIYSNIINIMNYMKEVPGNIFSM